MKSSNISKGGEIENFLLSLVSVMTARPLSQFHNVDLLEVKAFEMEAMRPEKPRPRGGNKFCPRLELSSRRTVAENWNHCINKL